MSRSTNSRTGGGELSTIIGPDAKLDGSLDVKHSMRVDGQVKGELISTETVTIGSGGSVEGDVSARDIVLGGKVTGKLTATGKVVMEGTSILTGDLKTTRLVVEEGSQFNGKSDMGEAEPYEASHPPRKINLSEE